MNSYTNLTTSIAYGGSKSEVSLNRGDKQGQPLSPFIFNAIKDPLLEQLEQMKGYVIDESQPVCASFRESNIGGNSEGKSAKDLAP